MATDKEYILTLARNLIERAQEMGVVLTITTVPRYPPAMGSYDMVAEVRDSRPVQQAKMAEAHRAKAAGEPYNAADL